MSEVKKSPVKKVLGGSKYANSKKKLKKQKLVKLENNQMIKKDRQLKVKIKHLEKELERIKKSGIIDSKSSQEVSIIEAKIARIGAKKKIFDLKILQQK